MGKENSVSQILKIKLLNPDAKILSFALPGDACFDIFTTEPKVLAPGERFAFPTGIASEIPVGYFVKYFDKSGLALKNGIHILAGVIDSGYRGEWKVIALNSGTETVNFEKGDKIAQGAVFAVIPIKIEVVESLSDSVRGEGGFGSTGKK